MLLCGSTWCSAAEDGSIDPEGAAGLFHRDVRVVSRLELRLNGQAPPVGIRDVSGPGAETRAGAVGPPLHPACAGMWVHRREITDEGMVDRFELRGLGGDAVSAELSLEVESDFADLLTLRYARPRPDPTQPAVAGPGHLRSAGEIAAVELIADPVPATTEPGRLVWHLTTPAEVSVCYRPSFKDTVPRRGRPTTPARLQVDGDVVGLGPAVGAGLVDLDALTIEAPDLGLRFVAAGAPWFMACFGRDSLLTGWQALIASAEPARLALETLRRHQGTTTDPVTHEEPGRLAHEIRIGGTSPFGLAPGRPFYGTIDASPLFVLLLAEAHRWGGDPGWVRSLLPAARLALQWCRTAGDRDDATPPGAPGAVGLRSHAWKDSRASVDGAAPVEVQAYVWAAHRALADLEERLGNPDAAPDLRAEAARRQAAALSDHWAPIDRLHDTVASAGSTAAHALWVGLVPEAAARDAAERLARPDLSTGFGLRTLATGEPGYNPLSYHAGSVWPHDTAFAVAGLARAGLADDAWRLSRDLLAAAAAFDHRLPELFGGIGRDDVGAPVPYPLACRPQAWSAAAPLLLLRALLGIDPDIPDGTVSVRPILPSRTRLEVEGICLGEAGHLDLRVEGREVLAASVPAGIRLVSPQAR